MNSQPIENHFEEMLVMVHIGPGVFVGEETGGRKQLTGIEGNQE